MNITRWDIVEELATKEDIIEYLKVVFESGNNEKIIRAISNAAKAINAHGLANTAEPEGAAVDRAYGRI